MGGDERRTGWRGARRSVWVGVGGSQDGHDVDGIILRERMGRGSGWL